MFFSNVSFFLLAILTIYCFSVQVIFYCLQGSHTFETDEDVVEKEVEFKKEVSEECNRFLLGLLTKEVGDRLTFKESLKHPWLEERD